jgi:death on curing protein
MPELSPVIARESDLGALALAYAFGLARNQRIVAGNEPTAFVATYAFHGLYDYQIETTEPDVVTAMQDVAVGRMPEAALAVWLRKKLRAIGGGEE